MRADDIEESGRYDGTYGVESQFDRVTHVVSGDGSGEFLLWYSKSDLGSPDENLILIDAKQNSRYWRVYVWDSTGQL